MDEEVESMHLKFLQQPPLGWTYVEALERFNANVSYSGLLHAVTGEVNSQEFVLNADLCFLVILLYVCIVRYLKTCVLL